MKDYEIGLSGKSQIRYTVQLKQTVNPLAANRDIKLKTNWPTVKGLLKDFSLMSSLETNYRTKDDRFLSGLKLLLNKLPSIAR